MPSIEEALNEQDRKSEAAKGPSFNVQQEFNQSKKGEEILNSRSLEDTFDSSSDGENATRFIHRALSNPVTKVASASPFIAGGAEATGLTGESQVLMNAATQYPEATALAAGVAAYGALDSANFQGSLADLARRGLSRDGETDIEDYTDLTGEEDQLYSVIQDPSEHTVDEVKSLIGDLRDEERYSELGLVYAAELDRPEEEQRSTITDNLPQEEERSAVYSSMKEILSDKVSVEDGDLEEYESRESSMLDYLR